MTYILAAFLAAHGLIHASYLTPAPPQTAGGPAWPFEVTRSWLVTGFGLDAAIMRSLAAVLTALTVCSLLAAAAATIGWLPLEWWAYLVVAGAASSLATLLLFFHPWLVLGVVIDLALLWVVAVNGWRPGVEGLP